MSKALLFTSVPANFHSQFLPEEAARRLKAKIKITSLLTLFKAAAVGRATPDKVVIYWSRPLTRNSFVPIFKGNFQTENGQTYLTGSFSMHLLIKLFMTIWFGACLTGILVALYRSVADGFDPGQLNMVGFQALMIAAGVAFVGFGKWLARNDIRLISEVIETAINPVT